MLPMKNSCIGTTLLVLSLLLLVTTTVHAAVTPSFQSLSPQREVTCLLERGEVILGGLDGGGLLMWPADDPAQATRLVAGQTISGNQVSDLAWSGRYVWVATLDGGMTRLGNPGEDAVFRPYTSNLGSLSVSAVAGAIVGNIERVFYAMSGAGLGVITDGLPGAIYTAEQDGLIDNTINDLMIQDEVLYIATPSGVGRLIGNTFSAMNNGLTNPAIDALTVDGAGRLICAGSGGVFRWDASAESWEGLNWNGGAVQQLGTNAMGVWALGFSGGNTGNVGYWDGSAWTLLELPQQKVTSFHAGADLWIGGRYSPSGMNSSNNGFAFMARWDGGSAWTLQTRDAPLPATVCGVTLEDDGTRWVGSLGGRCFSGQGDGESTHIYQVATVDNDSTGLFNHWSNLLCMASNNEGIVYACQYSSGIVRLDKNSGQIDLIHPWNSGMAQAHIVNAIVHPDGPLIMMHDWADDQKIQVLINPEDWADEANWVDVPQGAGQGIGQATGVFDALVERRDVIWLVLEGTGLMRWDINGYSQGPDDPLTWTDLSDDYFLGPFSEVSGTRNDLSQAGSIDMAPDGSFWVGGNGATRVRYAEGIGLQLVEAYGGKVSAYQDGLISGNVTDLAVDARGDCWISTSAGLNRIVDNSSPPEIDAWFNMATYLSNNTYPLLYSSNAVTEIPGGIHFRLVASPDRKTLAMTTSTGAVSWTVSDDSGGTSTAELAGVYFYPHPFQPNAADGHLKLGGIAADDGNDDGARVEIYNLEGQLVYRNSRVTADTDFWTGVNRLGNPVATGMYLVRVSWRDQVVTRSLAVVR